MSWTDQEIRDADLIHGPDRHNSDTYRLHIPGVGGKDGKMLDVPGWAVGDPEGAALRMRAAGIIRKRLDKMSLTGTMGD